MSIRTTVVLLAAALVAVAVPISADQPEPMPTIAEQVPLKVVLRLLNLGSPDQLTLGGIPEGLAAQISIPADVEVVGTVSHRRDDWSYDQVMGSSRLPPQELREALAESLEAKGWKPQASSRPEVTSGFAFATGVRDNPTFCGSDDAAVSISVTEKRDDGTSSFNLTHSAAREGSQCQEQWPQYLRDGPTWAKELVPVLEPPEGASSSPGGGGGSNKYMEIGAHVQTDLSPDELVDHYGGQLAAAGWSVGPAVALSKLAASEVSNLTPEGASVTGFLLARCDFHGQEMCMVTLSFSRN